jgi:hypothetical protein
MAPRMVATALTLVITDTLPCLERTGLQRTEAGFAVPGTRQSTATVGLASASRKGAGRQRVAATSSRSRAAASQRVNSSSFQPRPRTSR